MNSSLLKKYNSVFRILIAMVWFVNGLLCKVLNLVPRHEMIVQKILGMENPRLLTTAIGFGEILIGIWILSGIRTKFNTYFQIILVSSMNVLEYFLAPELLLWGTFNSLFALMFIIIVFMVEKHNTK